jgi:predicted O-linked N-acetylglucosamine transferase (SPINDLY family)
MDTVETLGAALEHHRQGHLDQAERMCRQVLANQPNRSDALSLLGQIALETNRAPEASRLLARAVALAPANAACRANLAEACRRLGRQDEAGAAFFTALALQPEFAEAVFNLGLLFEELGRADEALGCFRRAAELRPDSAAIKAQVAAARKKAAGAGKVSWPVGAAAASVLVEIATALRTRGDPDGAVGLCRRALDLRPRFPEALSVLGAAQTELTLVDEAIATFRRALTLSPDSAELHANLGTALAAAGLVDEAIESTRKAMALSPAPRTRANLVFFLQFSARASATDILAEARPFQTQFGAPLAGESRQHANEPSLSRRLRVGYVSPDFRDHCQTLFTVPLFTHHDHARFEIYGYSSVAAPDRATARLAGACDLWRPVHGVDDPTLASRIRQDGIDILVDLTMHMSQGRARLFASKPAPVQVCWLAYPGTTGLDTIDARISDPYLDPPEANLDVYSEKTVRLPETFWCYDPLIEGLDPGPLPARARGAITFGCLNNPMKLNRHVLALWARVLRAVGGSRLVVMAPLGTARKRIGDALAEAGIDRARVDFVKRCARPDYLALYRGIDLCLDTFPYGGHTTSLDALWMGVPVITLVGDRVVGRAGLSQAMNLGMPELVAENADEYVARASDGARDVGRLEATRQTLRTRMQASPLMDAARFARHLEAVYRQLWADWVGARSANSSQSR